MIKFILMVNKQVRVEMFFFYGVCRGTTKTSSSKESFIVYARLFFYVSLHFYTLSNIRHHLINIFSLSLSLHARIQIRSSFRDRRDSRRITTFSRSRSEPH